MSIPNIDNLLALDVETRLALVQKLWDSILEDARDAAALPVTASERALLDARLKEDNEDPEAAVSWDEARAELLRER